jgi:hypothetical protein
LNVPISEDERRLRFRTESEVKPMPRTLDERVVDGYTEPTSAWLAGRAFEARWTGARSDALERAFEDVAKCAARR